MLNWIRDFGGLYKGLSIFGSLLLWMRDKIRGDVFTHVLAKRLFKTDDDWELLQTDSLVTG